MLQARVTRLGRRRPRAEAGGVAGAGARRARGVGGARGGLVGGTLVEPAPCHDGGVVERGVEHLIEIGRDWGGESLHGRGRDEAR